MDIKTCLEEIQSFHDLSHFQTVFPDENIENGLCRPDDENLFLTSSLAFLHKQLLRKMEQEIVSKQDSLETDLLILDSTDGKEKVFIKLKNPNCFEETMKTETTIPSKKLHLNQILPKVKKNKAKSALFRSFVKKSNSRGGGCGEGFLPTKSNSLFSILIGRREPIRPVVVETSLPTKKIEIIDKYFNSIPSTLTYMPPSSESLTAYSDNNQFSKPASKVSIISSIPSLDVINKINSSAKYKNKICSYNKHSRHNLTKNDLNVINFLPQLPTANHCNNKCFRRTVNRKDLNFGNVENDVLRLVNVNRYIGYSPSEPKAGNKLVKHPSKLSVCLEEETDSEMDGYVTQEERNGILNFTDELKSNLSPKLLELVMNAIVRDFRS